MKYDVRLIDKKTNEVELKWERVEAAGKQEALWCCLDELDERDARNWNSLYRAEIQECY